MKSTKSKERSWTKTIKGLFGLCLGVVALWMIVLFHIAETQARIITVGTGADYPTIQRALSNARHGDTIRVWDGRYRGPININKSVALIGKNYPQIVGQGAGTVVTIDTSKVVFQGFKVRRSGKTLNREDAGISVNGAHCIIRDNRLEDVLFGIYLRRADSSRIAENHISGYKDIKLAERGDLIRVWYSDYVTISENYTEHGRDAVIWFANHIFINDNTFTRGRYGLHFMYSDSATIRHNRMLYNSVGAYLMYSKRLQFEHNAIAYNRTGSAMGIGLKAMDRSRVRNNAIVDNNIGIYVDNSPRSIHSKVIYHRNIVAYNDIGVQTTNAVPRSHFTHNSFRQNFEQVEVSGRGSFTNESSSYWRNNYWSTYSGFDSNRDGIGEEPYLYTDYFATMSDQVSAMKLYSYSPSVQALRIAARAFPLIRPEPKLKDTLPQMAPVEAKNVPAISLPTRWPLAGISTLMIGLGIASFWVSKREKRKGEESKKVMDADDRNTNADNKSAKLTYTHKKRNRDIQTPLIKAEQVTKRFGKQTALEEVSFSMEKGESLALWGPNGAGKTTLLRCLLGVLPFEGKIEVEGERMRMDQKELRKKIGFVPQNISFYPNFTIRELLELISRLRKVKKPDIKAALQEVELHADANKKIHQLSGGMKQRLALAAALLGDPPLLLLDEPMASLDLEGRRAFIDWLKELNTNGKSLILSTHHTDQIKALAERVLILDQGRVANEVPATEFESWIS